MAGNPTPFRSFGCRCATQQEHDIKTGHTPQKPMSKRIRDLRTLHKLPSEGYVPVPGEEVELRGD